MEVLVLNSSLYLIWFIFNYRMNRNANISNVLSFFYLTISILGIFIVYNGIYTSTINITNFNRLSIIPYLLCFISIILFFRPLKYFKTIQINPEKLFTKKVYYFVNSWTIFYFFYTILKLQEALIAINSGLSKVYDDRHHNNELVLSYSNNFILSNYIKLADLCLDPTVPFIVVFSIIGIRLRKISLTISLCLIALCFLPAILQSISISSRGSLFSVMLSIVFFYYILNEYFDKKIKKYIHISFATIGIGIIFYLGLITLERYHGNSSESYQGVLRYFGEPFPNLGLLYWEKVRFFPMGKRLFPDIFFLNYKSFYTSVGEYFNYWSYKTGVPIHYFKTLFGDLYIEFGSVGALIFAFTFSSIFLQIFKKRKLNIYNLTFAYYYFKLCIYAFARFSSGSGFINHIYAIVIFFFVVKFLIRPSSN